MLVRDHGRCHTLIMRPNQIACVELKNAKHSSTAVLIPIHIRIQIERDPHTHTHTKRAHINRVECTLNSFYFPSPLLDEQIAFVDHNSNGEDVFYVCWSEFFVVVVGVTVLLLLLVVSLPPLFPYCMLPSPLHLLVYTACQKNTESMVLSNVYCVCGEYAFLDTYFIGNTSFSLLPLIHSWNIYGDMFRHVAIFSNTPESQQKGRLAWYDFMSVFTTPSSALRFPL